MSIFPHEIIDQDFETTDTWEGLVQSVAIELAEVVHPLRVFYGLSSTTKNEVCLLVAEAMW